MELTHTLTERLQQQWAAVQHVHWHLQVRRAQYTKTLSCVQALNASQDDCEYLDIGVDIGRARLRSDSGDSGDLAVGLGDICFLID